RPGSGGARGRRRARKRTLDWGWAAPRLGRRPGRGLETRQQTLLCPSGSGRRDALLTEPGLSLLHSLEDFFERPWLGPPCRPDGGDLELHARVGRLAHHGVGVEKGA